MRSGRTLEYMQRSYVADANPTKRDNKKISNFHQPAKYCSFNYKTKSNNYKNFDRKTNKS